MNMNEPGAHFKDVLQKLKFRASDCRKRAADLQLQATVLDDAALEVELAIEAEAKKRSDSAGEQQK